MISPDKRIIFWSVFWARAFEYDVNKVFVSSRSLSYIYQVGQKKVSWVIWPHYFVTTPSKIVKIITIHNWNVFGNTVKFQSSNQSSFEDYVQDVSYVRFGSYHYPRKHQLSHVRYQVARKKTRRNLRCNIFVTTCLNFMKLRKCHL